MNKNLEKAIAVLEAEIGERKGSLAIHGNHPDESTISGTREGFLELAKAMLCLVAEFDDAGKDAHWDDQIKHCLLSMPTWDLALVGAEVFDSHSRFIEGLKEAFAHEPHVIASLDNDPDFGDPNP